jgi:hypothetical protein
LSWLKGNFLLVQGDYAPPLSYNLILGSRYIWNGYLGGSLEVPVKIFPYWAFWAFFQFIGVSLINVQRLWFTFIFVMPAASMYFFSRVMWPEKKYRIGWFISALFYALNPLTFYPLSDTPVLTYAFLPLFAGILVIGLRKRENKYAILLALSSVLFYTSAANPPLYITIWVMAAALFVYCVLTSGKKLSTICFSLKAIGLIILVNLWWIIGELFLLLNLIANTITISAPLSLDYVSSHSQMASFLNLFRLFGSWSMLQGTNGYLYYPYMPEFFTTALILITYLIPILVFSALLFKGKNRAVLFFSFLALFFLFLSKGLHSPLASVNQFLYVNIPGFSFFREPITFFLPLTAFCYAVLLGITTGEIHNGINKVHMKLSPIKRKTAHVAVTAFIVIIILVGSWPVLTGATILGQRGVLPSTYVKIPSYWYEASDWLNSQPSDFKILLSPENPATLTHYNWGWFGPDVAGLLINDDLISVNPQSYTAQNPFYYSVYQAISSLSNSTSNVNTVALDNDIYKLLAAMNVKYILQRNDLDYTYFNSSSPSSISPQVMNSILSNLKGISLVKTFGELDIYEVDNFVPTIYGASNVILENASSSEYTNWINGNISDLNGGINIELPESNFTLRSNGFYTAQGCLSDYPSQSTPIEVGSQSFLFVSFKTNVDSSIIVAVLTPDGTQFLIADNPTSTMDGLNHYSSESWYTLAFSLSSIVSQIDGVEIFLSNSPNPTYDGQLALEIESIKLVEVYYPPQPASALAVNAMLSYEFIPGQSCFLFSNEILFNITGITGISEQNQSYVPQITSQEISPVQYVIHVNCTQPFFLVFSENFDPSWKIYNGQINSFEALWTKPLYNGDHVTVNGFANAWYINKTGSYAITLIYWPQVWYDVGIIISALTVTSSLLYLFLLYLKKGMNEKWLIKINGRLKRIFSKGQEYL